MELKPLEVLSQDELKQISSASYSILENCGIKILNPEMFDFLKSKGLPDAGNGIIKFPKAVVEDALASVPKTFDVFDREGKFAYTIGTGKPKVSAGHNAVFWFDSDTKETRNSKIADVELFAHICQQLSNIDMIGIPVMPQDVTNPSSSLLYGVKAVIENSTKPLYFSTDKSDVNRSIIEMLKAVYPGDLSKEVYGISQLSPTSPLFWEKDVCVAIKDTVMNDVPLAILPEPIAGVSAPYTLAGLVTVNNTECISGIVIAQLLKKSAKMLYANSWTTTDMRSGSALVGSIETTICRVAGRQLAKYYGIPCHTTAPNSDNHAHDEQNAWEKTFSQFAAIAAGNDLVVNCGMFATGMTCSHEQLIMDDEITSMCRRFVQGVDVNSDTIGEEVIREIGPASADYLSNDHTMDYLRSDEFLIPKLAIRGNKATWDANGSKDTYAIATDSMKKYAELERDKIDVKRQQLLNDIVAQF